MCCTAYISCMSANSLSRQDFRVFCFTVKTAVLNRLFTTSETSAFFSNMHSDFCNLFLIGLTCFNADLIYIQKFLIHMVSVLSFFQNILVDLLLTHERNCRLTELIGRGNAHRRPIWSAAGQGTKRSHKRIQFLLSHFILVWGQGNADIAVAQSVPESAWIVNTAQTGEIPGVGGIVNYQLVSLIQNQVAGLSGYLFIVCG